MSYEVTMVIADLAIAARPDPRGLWKSLEKSFKAGRPLTWVRRHFGRSVDLSVLSPQQMVWLDEWMLRKWSELTAAELQKLRKTRESCPWLLIMEWLKDAALEAAPGPTGPPRFEVVRLADGFEPWCRAVLEAGNIPQDDGPEPEYDPGSIQEAYEEMIAQVTGREGFRVFETVVRSLRVEEDYGIYSTPIHQLFVFDPETCAEFLLRCLPDLLERQPRWAQGIIDELPADHEARFRAALSAAPTSLQEALEPLIGD